MAFNLLKMLGMQPKGRDLTQEMNLIKNAPKPPSSIFGVPATKTLNDMVLAALQRGEGLGYGEDFVNKTTSPLVAQREARFTNQELPFMEGEYSGRGLGRSTLAARDIGQASAQKERDINEVMANAILMNEQQKKADLARNQQAALTLGQLETGQQGLAAGEEASRNQQIASLFGNQAAQQKADEAGVWNNINSYIGLAASLAMQDPTKALNFAKEAKKATPFVSNWQPNFAW